MPGAYLDDLTAYLKEQCSPDELKLFKDILTDIGAEKESPSFPIIASLEINNLNTFSKLPEFKFKDGINVIFGCVGAGKTTLLNATYFTLFGKSEYYEFNYFDNRKENGNFNSAITFETNGNAYRICREIIGTRHEPVIYRFQSTPQKTLGGSNFQDWVPLSESKTVNEVESNMITIFNSDLATLRKIYDFTYLREIDVANYLLMNEGTRNMRKEITLKFLGSNKMNKVIARITCQIDLYSKKIQSLKNGLKFIAEKLNQIENIDDKNIVEKIKVLSGKLEDLHQKKREKENEERDSFKKWKEARVKIASSEIAAKRGELLVQIDKLKKVIEKETSFKKLIEDKKDFKCQICNRDFKEIGKERLLQNECPSCGLRIEDRRIIEETRLRLREFQTEFEKIDADYKDISKELDDSEKKFVVIRSDQKLIDNEIDTINLEVSVLNSQLGQKELKIDVSEKGIIERQLEENEKELTLYQNLYLSINTFITNEDKFKSFMAKLNDIFISLQEKVFLKMFGGFDTDFNFVAVKTYFSNLSSGQKRLLDIIFRIAYMMTLCELQIIPKGFLVLDTPDVKIDEGFYETLSEIINTSSKHIKFIITAIEPRFIALLKYTTLYDINIFSHEIPAKKTDRFQKQLASFLRQ